MTSLICECELTSWILNEQKRIEPRANPPDSSRKSIFCCSNLDKKNCNEILYSGGTFLFAYRTVPPRCSLPFGVLAIRSGIWIFVFDEWGFGWGVRSEVSSQLHLQPVSNSTCTFYSFSLPLHPLTAAFHSDRPFQIIDFCMRTVHRTVPYTDWERSGRLERQVREIWILTRLIKYILYRLRCEPADVLSS